MTTWRLRLQGAIVRPLFLAAAAAVVLAAGVPAARATQAAPNEGTIAVVPAAGNDQTPFTMVTSNACPAGTNVFATIFGSGFPATGKVIVGNAPVAIYEHNAAGGVALPIADTLRSFASQEDNPLPLSGTYKLQVTCRDGAKAADLGYFEGSISFTDPHTYAASNLKVTAAELALLPAPGVAAAITAPGQKAGTQQTLSLAKAEHTQAKSHTLKQLLFFGAGGALVLFGLVTVLRNRKDTAAAA